MAEVWEFGGWFGVKPDPDLVEAVARELKTFISWGIRPAVVTRAQHLRSLPRFGRKPSVARVVDGVWTCIDGLAGVYTCPGISQPVSSDRLRTALTWLLSKEKVQQYPGDADYRRERAMEALGIKVGVETFRKDGPELDLMRLFAGILCSRETLNRFWGSAHELHLAYHFDRCALWRIDVVRSFVSETSGPLQIDEPVDFATWRFWGQRGHLGWLTVSWLLGRCEVGPASLPIVDNAVEDFRLEVALPEVTRGERTQYGYTVTLAKEWQDRVNNPRREIYLSQSEQLWIRPQLTYDSVYTRILFANYPPYPPAIKLFKNELHPEKGDRRIDLRPDGSIGFTLTGLTPYLYSGVSWIWELEPET